MASSRRSAKNADRTAPATATVLAALDAALREAALPAVDAPPLVLVAFSGGLDSSVLLHALASRGDRVRLHAVHVAVKPGGMADRLSVTLRRHAGFMPAVGSTGGTAVPGTL